MFIVVRPGANVRKQQLDAEVQAIRLPRQPHQLEAWLAVGQTRADVRGRLAAFLQNPDHAVRFRKFFRRDNPNGDARGR